MINGTQGYAKEADILLKRYEKLSFAEKHRHVLHLIPDASCSVLDIGAGTGADAGALAESGHHVVAAEPTDELRMPGMDLHPSEQIEWVKDSLPDLKAVRERGQQFDLVMMTAVWMHLDRDERARGMPNVASLVRKGGLLILSLRHGPVPPGRRMFEVSATETIELAESFGLKPILNVYTDSIQARNRQAGVTWTRLAFVRDSA